MVTTIQELDEWVQDKLLDYAAKGYSQEDVRQLGGHFCHHPTPRCKGGTEGVWMFIEDHAIHGVLQSEVFQHPCIYGWEAEYLDGELYDLCKKWHSLKAVPMNSSPNMVEIRRKNGEKVGVHPNSYASRAKTLHMRAKKLNEHPNMVEVRKRNNEIKWMCLETGKISTAGPLSQYQKTRGIDTSKRARLTPEETAFIFLWA